MDSLSRLKQDKMASLSKLKRRGMDNIYKVTRTGKEFVNKYNSYKIVSNPFLGSYFGSAHNRSTNNKNNVSLGSVTSSTIQEDEILNSNQDVYSKSEGRVCNSQISLNSDAATLVNNDSCIDNIYSVKHQLGKKLSYDGSLCSSTTLNELNTVDTTSFGSSPITSPIFSRQGSVVSLPSTIPFDSPKEKVVNEKIKMYMQKNKNVPKHLLKPNEEIKQLIINYGHTTAHEEGKTKLLHYYQLPFPWRENCYIIRNYRFYSSHKKSLLSVINWYGWHNETFNIWSHLIGAVYMMYLAIYTFPKSEVFQSDTVPLSAKCILYVFLAASLKCLLASVFWHTFNGTCILKLRRKFACVDYSGISILITASILTVEFVSLYEHEIPMFFYMFVSLSLGTVGVFLNCSPKFDSPESRPLRIRFFILLAFMGILSFFHATYLESFHFSKSLLSMVFNNSIIWYLIGVIFYGSFIPERFRTDVVVDASIPTTFQLSTDVDIITKEEHIHFRSVPVRHHNPRRGLLSLWWVDYVGCSHTFWHFFVVLGVIGHYRAVYDMFSTKWL